MKLLAFTDTHADPTALIKIKQKAIKYKPDLLICCGDLSIFGKGLDITAKFLNKLNIKILTIPSNHESPGDIKKLCEKYKNFINLHKGEFICGDYSFFGWGNEGFSLIEENFEILVKQFKKTYDKKKKLIFITHAPPYQTELDDLSEKGLIHVGCKSTRKFIEEVEPILVLCGHIHENFIKKDKIKNSLIINPGPNGMIIEI